MPQTWEEFTPAELAPALGESRGRAEGVLDLAHDLAVKLPGTRAAFLSGVVSLRKAAIIARATGALDPGEARGPGGNCRPPPCWPPTSGSPRGPRS
jgi:hypothetical protein